MEPRSGDIVISGPGRSIEPDLFQHAIMLTGAKHTHDEPLGKVHGKLMCGNAHTPQYELTPLSYRIAQYDAGLRRVAVVRWHGFVTEPDDGAHYREYRHAVNACLRLADLQPWQYDKSAIHSHIRNYIRAYLRKIPALSKLKAIATHKEYEVYCTEGTFNIVRVGGIDMRSSVGDQPLVSPIHIDRLLALGLLRVVVNYGFEHLPQA